jgi:hypothetical protein
MSNSTALSLAEARERRRAAREQREWETQKRIMDAVLNPNVIRLLLVAGIIAYSTQATRSKENVGPVQSALALALPGIGIPLIAADAGIRDKYALAAISAAGTGYAVGQMAVGWKDAYGGQVTSLLDELKDIPQEMVGVLSSAASQFTSYRPW